MLGTSNRRFGLLFITVVMSLVINACGGGSGPGPLPMRPDAGTPDGGVSQFGIVSPAANAVITLSDDLDGNAGNGIQIAVRVSALSIEEGNVNLAVNNDPSQEAAVIDNFADFQISLPADVNGAYRLVASATDLDGNSVESTTDINVSVSACQLNVTPRPQTNGCAFGVGGDENAELDGVQVVFAMEANCPDLSIRANGDDPQSVEVVDGQSQYEMTLVNGQNTLSVELKNGEGDTVTESFVFDAQTSPGALQVVDLNEGRLNRFLIADGDRQDRITYWEISGQSTNFASNETLTVEFEPPLGEDVLTTSIRSDGTFKFEVSLADDEFYEGTMTIQGTDACGSVSSSASIPVRFDAVTPVLSLTSPLDNSLLTAADDTAGLRSGVQVAVAIEVSDVRPSEVDYSIGVECGAVGPNPVYTERTVLASDTVLRSALLDEDPTNDFAIVTFQSSEAGEYICRPLIKEQTNPPTSQGSVWRAYFRTSSLTVVAPTAFPSCIAEDGFEIRAVGQNIDGNQPILFYSLSTNGEQIGDTTLLSGSGNNLYTANVSNLDDGPYVLSFEGTILGEVPVVFEPQSLEIYINREAPTIQFTAPAGPYFEDVDLVQPGTQTTVSLEVCGAAGRDVVLTTTSNLGQQEYTLPVTSEELCSTVDFPLNNVPLGDVVMSASVTDNCGLVAQASRTSSVDPSTTFAQIRSLDSGARINVSQDQDAERTGCQFVVRAETNGVSSNANLAICSSAAIGTPNETCLGLPNVIDGACTVVGAGSIEGSSLIECPVSLVDGAQDLSLVAVEGERVESAAVSITADCSPPTLVSISVPEDVDGNGCVNMREVLGDASGNDFSVQMITTGLSDGTRVELRDGLNALFGFGLVSDSQVTVSGSLEDSQAAVVLTATAQDEVGNGLVTTDGASSIEIRVDRLAPSLTSTNLDPLDCLGIAKDADLGQNGFQFTPIINVNSSVGELVNVQVQLDGITLHESGPQALARIDMPQLSLPDGSYNLAAVVSDTCGNVGSAFGFEQVNNVDDWTSPIANVFSIDTVAPVLTLDGLIDGTTYTAEQDADNDSSNGFQVNAQVLVDAVASLEEGQTIEVLADGLPLSVEPSPFLMGSDASAPQFVSLTLGAGPQAVTVRTQDACGNESPAVEPITVTLDVNGCTSQIEGFDSNPQIITVNDGAIVETTFAISIDARVDIFNAACVGASAQLLVDNTVVGTQVVPDGGALQFTNIALTSGSRSVKLRVSEESLDTVDSPVQVLRVDIETPIVAFAQLNGIAATTDEINVIITDTDNDPSNGQQVSITGTVTESSVATARTVTFSVDGSLVDSVSIADTSDTAIAFDQTLSPGIHVLELCVADEANPQNCASVTVNADPAPPGSITDLTSTIVNARGGHIELSFTAPGDDGLAGSVTGYAMRVVQKDDANAEVTQEQWDAAAASELVVNDASPVGSPVTIIISGMGPGSRSTQVDGIDVLNPVGSLAEGFVPNQLHHLVIAPMDDTAQLGPFSEATVDLRWNSQTFDIPSLNGDWTAGGEAALATPINRIGDVDGSGSDDVLVTFFKFTGGFQSAAALILGDSDPSQTAPLQITLPVGLQYISSAAGGRDLNGDDIPDFVVTGYSFTPDFSGYTSYVGIYLGVVDDQNALLAPDAVFTFPNHTFTGTSMIGNFNHRLGDGADYADILVGGGLYGESSAYVIAGRTDWRVAAPAPETTFTIVSGNDTANRTLGVIAVETVGTSLPGLVATSIGDQNNDGRDEIALSAGTTPGFVYILSGGDDLPARVTITEGQLFVPSCMDEAGPNETVGFGSAMVGGSDLDGVSGSDLVVSNTEQKIAVFDQDLSEIDCFTVGRFQFGRRLSLAGDLNGDGHSDLIVAHGVRQNVEVQTNTNAYIFYNDGSGSFGIPYNTGIQRYAHFRLDQIPLLSGSPNYESGLSGVAGIGDFNGDGAPDLGAVIKQTGAGSLQLVVYY